MFYKLRNKDRPINNNQYNVVGEHKSLFLKMDPKCSEKYKINRYLVFYFHLDQYRK